MRSNSAIMDVHSVQLVKSIVNGGAKFGSVYSVQTTKLLDKAEQGGAQAMKTNLRRIALY